MVRVQNSEGEGFAVSIGLGDDDSLGAGDTDGFGSAADVCVGIVAGVASIICVVAACVFFLSIISVFVACDWQSCQIKTPSTRRRAANMTARIMFFLCKVNLLNMNMVGHRRTPCSCCHRTVFAR